MTHGRFYHPGLGDEKLRIRDSETLPKGHTAPSRETRIRNWGLAWRAHEGESRIISFLRIKYLGGFHLFAVTQTLSLSAFPLPTPGNVLVLCHIVENFNRLRYGGACFYLILFGYCFKYTHTYMCKHRDTHRQDKVHKATYSPLASIFLKAPFYWCPSSKNVSAEVAFA